ncbi:sodium/glucose cotransporter [Plakobranchus ocellatus]|uniref:Sodium/glucose cotransporter n=1 Tax=Plakobranchus ocellatus TaxID=259542 RepID=A0AAV4AHF1_9GAST|nr:sodium/glucose cotransporter [Plakobranchus ocellatus]
MLSTGVGVCRMVLEFVYPAPFCGSGDVDTRPTVLTKVNFLHFAIIISAVSLISTVTVSLFTTPRPQNKLQGVTWWTRYERASPEESEVNTESAVDQNGITQIEDTMISSDTREKCLSIVIKWLCGYSHNSRSKQTKSDQSRIKNGLPSIYESPNSRRLLNVLAVAVSAATVFLLVFFG